jgi:hypothetical protein
MLKTEEKNAHDKVTGEAVKKFLKNIFDANVRIVMAYGLV